MSCCTVYCIQLSLDDYMKTDRRTFDLHALLVKGGGVLVWKKDPLPHQGVKAVWAAAQDLTPTELHPCPRLHLEVYLREVTDAPPPTPCFICQMTKHLYVLFPLLICSIFFQFLQFLLLLFWHKYSCFWSVSKLTYFQMGKKKIDGWCLWKIWWQLLQQIIWRMWC